MATIGFRETSYTVIEGEGSILVEVALLSGSIPVGNQVEVTLTTSDDTASGIYNSRFSVRNQFNPVRW